MFAAESLFSYTCLSTYTHGTQVVVRIFLLSNR